MLAEIIRPDLFGKATVPVPDGTRYILVSETFPDLEVTAIGQEAVLLYCPAGGQAVIGIQGEIPGYDLPSVLSFYWRGADIQNLQDPDFVAAAETAGGINAQYGAVIYFSRQPIRLTAGSAGIRASSVYALLGDGDGDKRTVATVARIDSVDQGGLLVAAQPPLRPTYFANAASPGLPLAVSTYAGVSGLVAIQEVSPYKGPAHVTSCEISIRGYPDPAAVVEFILYLIDTSSAFPALGSPGTSLTQLEDLDPPYQSQIRTISRPNVPIYDGSQPIISRRVARRVDAAGQIVEVLGPHGVWLRDGYAALGLSVQSSVAGNLTVYTSFTWQEGPAAWLA